MATFGMIARCPKSAPTTPTGLRGSRCGTFCKTLLVLQLTIPSVVYAGRATDPLEGQPAVRHRYELRAQRFEIGPSFGFSLNRALRHAFLFGARLQYHLTDYLGLGADIAAGVGADTGLAGELESRTTPAQWSQRHDRFADIRLAGDVRVVFTPFAGKVALFSKFFFNYDFYLFSGFGFALTRNNFDTVSEADDVDAANEGFQPGFAWGFGMRVYITHYFALALELRDLLFNDNESGGDKTRGLSSAELDANAVRIDGDDRSFSNHFFFGLSLTFFLPATPDVSN